jgi:hypothetical protein
MRAYLMGFVAIASGRAAAGWVSMGRIGSVDHCADPATISKSWKHDKDVGAL